MKSYTKRIHRDNERMADFRGFRGFDHSVMSMQLVASIKATFPKDSYTLRGHGVWFKTEREMRSREMHAILKSDAIIKRERKNAKRKSNFGV